MIGAADRTGGRPGVTVTLLAPGPSRRPGTLPGRRSAVASITVLGFQHVGHCTSDEADLRPSSSPMLCSVVARALWMDRDVMVPFS